MIIELAAGAYLLGSYAYHRWFEDPPPKPKPARTIDIPRTDDGAPVPLIYGRCRVRSPWLAWVGTPDTKDLGDGVFEYLMSMYFVVGIGFGDDANNRLRFIRLDDAKVLQTDSAGPGGPGIELTGNGNFETPKGFSGGGHAEGFNGLIEYLNGKPDQIVCDANTPFTARTFTGQQMIINGPMSGALVPGFRGYMSVLFFANTNEGDNGGGGFTLGTSPKIPKIDFEMHSYPAVGYLGPSPQIGEEANPADVLANLLTGTRGKLGYPVSKLDLPTFEAAAATLAAEGLGWSRSSEDGGPAGEVVDEILRYVDGILYEDPASGKWRLKLVRADYDPSTVFDLNPTNTEDVENLSAGGRINLVNKIRVVFTNRDRDYQDDSVESQNMANAVGQDGVVNELVLRYPGCCTAAQAQTICDRETSARSRPIAKFRAVCDRTAVRVNPGDVVSLTWPEYNVDGVLFRVAAVTRGDRDSSKVSLDLIQEFFFSHRGTLFGGLGTVVGFPFGGAVG